MATRRNLTTESKDQAVSLSLVLDSGRSIAEVARTIDVHGMTLGTWVKKKRDADTGDEKSAELTGDERAELDRLRGEVARLRMERDFARKVATWSPKEQP